MKIGDNLRITVTPLTMKTLPQAEMKRMELLFLGTGAGTPSRQRNVTSIALNLQGVRSGCWLFDCGEGTQHQMMRSPVKAGKIEKIFITHLHGDHIFGLRGCLPAVR